MKGILFVLFTIVSMSGNAQKWRDSLTVARDAYKKGDFEKAYNYTKSAQKNAPDDVDLSAELGQSSYRTQRFEEAEDYFSQNAIAENDRTKKASSFRNVGNAQMMQKNYQGAIESYKEALRNNPNDEKTRFNLSEAIRELKNQNQQKNQNEQNKDEQNNDSQNNKQNQNQQGQNDTNGKNNSSSQSSNQENNTQSNSGGKSNTGQSPKLQDKAVDKKLDDLMKQEAETKRRLGGRETGESSAKSGKDW